MNKTSTVDFSAKQTIFAQQVKELNELLFNALNVELEKSNYQKYVPHWEVIAASMPGIIKKGSHIGYAETEELNDIDIVFSQLVNSSSCFIAIDRAGWVYPDAIINTKHEIKQAKERNQENNLTGSGRILAKFNYLLQKKHG